MLRKVKLALWLPGLLGTTGLEALETSLCSLNSV
jgi:hypothetical protein